MTDPELDAPLQIDSKRETELISDMQQIETRIEQKLKEIDNIMVLNSDEAPHKLEKGNSPLVQAGMRQIGGKARKLPQPEKEEELSKEQKREQAAMKYMNKQKAGATADRRTNMPPLSQRRLTSNQRPQNTAAKPNEQSKPGGLQRTSSFHNRAESSKAKDQVKKPPA